MINGSFFKDECDFVTTDEKEFLDFIDERDKNSLWISDVELAKLDLIGYDDGPLGAGLCRNQVSCSDEILDDTLGEEGTSLFLWINPLNQKGYIPVRACALQSLSDRACLYGKALDLIPREKRGEWISQALRYNKGVGKVRVADGKVSAVLSNQYSEISAPEVYHKTAEKIQKEFPGSYFMDGAWNHRIIVGKWYLRDAAGTEINIGCLQGTKWANAHPILRVVTSETGFASAMCCPFIDLDGCVIPMNSEMSVTHKGKNTIDKFEESLDCIWESINDMEDGLEKLMNTKIINGANCLLGVMKRIGISRTKTYKIKEMFDVIYGNSSVTAMDVYMQISELLNDIQNPEEAVRMQDTVARALGLNWSEYDVPGEFVW